jgi:hypothetical protein
MVEFLGPEMSAGTVSMSWALTRTRAPADCTIFFPIAMAIAMLKM